MKRLALNLVVALIAFTVGSTLPTLRKTPKLTPGEIKVCLLEPSMCVDQDLVRRLDTIQRRYEKRCLIYPEDWEEHKEKKASGWLDRCYAEWEEARRIAVEGK